MSKLIFYHKYSFLGLWPKNKNHACSHTFWKDKKENKLYFNKSDESEHLVLQFKHQQNIFGLFRTKKSFSGLVTFKVNIVKYDCKCPEK